MRVPELSIPTMETLPDYDIGAWRWSQPISSEKSRATLPNGDVSVGVGGYQNHHVRIEHYQGQWFAAAEKDGVCLISGVWKEDPKHPKKLGALVDYAGEHAKFMNPEFTDLEKSKRIWDFLRTEALAMKLQVATTQTEMANKNMDMYGRETGVNVLKIWGDR